MIRKKGSSKLKRATEYCMLALVLIGSVLLSSSIGSSRLFFVSLTCALAGFIVTDTLKLFRIGGWLANTASILVLILAMKDFFGVDSSGKLVAVANLLVYLQSILMFQDKTPRLNWQILVLSLLEVVITTIFSVGFENSYLLALYFAIAGGAMVLQCLFVDELDIARRNGNIARQLGLHAPVAEEFKPMADELDAAVRPENAILAFDAPSFRYRDLWPMFSQFGAWLIAGAVITSVVFLMAPRTTRPLFKSISFKVSATGVSARVDLNERGRITQSDRVVFHSKLRRSFGGDPFRLLSPIYFRSMALSSLRIEDGHTTWRAAFDRIDDTCYDSPQTSLMGRKVLVETTLQPNTSPQLYGMMPVALSQNSPSSITFCHDIAALTRSKYDGQVSATPYKYELLSVIDEQNVPLKAWPYVSQLSRYSLPDYSLDSEPLKKDWLTQIDRSRYKTLVATADRIANEVKAQGGTRQELIQRMSDWFSSNRFKYTLDYTSVKRDESLDTVEDFFRNHRSGHCEMYASALVLMLRSQGVPARLVVGFLGNEYNDLTKSYVVKEKHAHAWVEAYLHPSKCTNEMFASGAAGRGGAWLIADPNPLEVLATGNEDTNDPLELARTVWQDIVLGLDNQKETGSYEDGSALYQLITDIRIKGELTVGKLKQLPGNSKFQLALAGLLLGGLLLKFFGSMGKTKGRTASGKKISLLRRVVATAVGLLSPSLESWVLASAQTPGTEFYQKLEKLLQRHGLTRMPTQSHRQFAKTVSARFHDRPQHDQIDQLVYTLTERFNALRFGDAPFSDQEDAQARQQLRQLEQVLEQ